MSRPSTAILLLALFTTTAASGCFARGDVSFQMEDPRPDAWTPTGLLLAAIEAADADPNATMLLEYGVTFGEDGVIRILELRILTENRQTGNEFYLDYLVGRDYDPEADTVEFRGFRHDEGDKTDPAKEWALVPEVLAILDQQTFAAMAANETQRLGDVPIVQEFSLGADCAPVWQQTDKWHIYNATGEGMVDAGGGWDLECYTRARLPPTMLVNLHTPCFKNPQCPQADVHQFLVNYPEPVA